MVFDSSTRTISIFSGQRGESLLGSWTLGPIPTRLDAVPSALVGLARPITASTTPPPAFTQRFILDPNRQEWVAWTGGADDEANAPLLGHSTVWRKSTSTPTQKEEWEEVGGDVGPPPRFAASFTLDPLRSEYYVFGGNPLDPDDSNRRLGDLWRLTIRP